MIKLDCIECGKPFEVEEKDKWKTKCMDCFRSRSTTITPKQDQKPTPMQEIRKQEQDKSDKVREDIKFGNCLNASGMALSGSGTTPKQHYDYAKELYALWLGKEELVE